MRSYNRFIIDQVIECNISGKKDKARLYNLSCGGCMLETKSTLYDVDGAVQVNLGEAGVQKGRIAWCVKKNVGIQFIVPLEQKVVENFGFSAGQDQFDSHDPRDRFGIPLV